MYQLLAGVRNRRRHNPGTDSQRHEGPSTKSSARKSRSAHCTTEAALAQLMGLNLLNQGVGCVSNRLSNCHFSQCFSLVGSSLKRFAMPAKLADGALANVLALPHISEWDTQVWANPGEPASHLRDVVSSSADFERSLISFCGFDSEYVPLQRLSRASREIPKWLPACL